MRPVVLPKMGYWLFPPPLEPQPQTGAALATIENEQSDGSVNWGK